MQWTSVLFPHFTAQAQKSWHFLWQIALIFLFIIPPPFFQARLSRPQVQGGGHFFGFKHLGHESDAAFYSQLSMDMSRGLNSNGPLIFIGLMLYLTKYTFPLAFSMQNRRCIHSQMNYFVIKTHSCACTHTGWLSIHYYTDSTSCLFCRSTSSNALLQKRTASNVAHFFLWILAWHGLWWSAASAVQNQRLIAAVSSF